MPALNQNLELWQDRTSIITIPILDINGQPYTQTTPTNAQWAMALNPRGAAPVVAKSTVTPPGGIALNFVSGTWQAVITLEYSDMRGITPQNYYHELSVTDNAGDVVNVTVGTINLQPSLVQY